MATATTHERIFGLDVLRASAIAAVIVSHGRHFWTPVFPGASRLFTLGIGVDVFFVLSGFLIGGILIRDLERDASAGGLTRFWARRWMRTLPNYLLFLGINLAMPAGPFAGRDTPRGLWRYFLFLQNVRGQAPTFFEESWSLAIEEWFYLAVPLAAFAMAAIRPVRCWAVPAAAIGVGLASVVARLIDLTAPGKSVVDLQRGVIYRMDSMAIGVVAAYLACRAPAFWARARWPGLIVGLPLLIALLGFRLTDGMDTPAARLLFTDGSALGAALLLPAVSMWRGTPGGVGRMVTRISAWSYSMYLINTPLLVLAKIYLPAPKDAGGCLMLWSGWVFAVTFASCACYRFYERRMTALRDLDWARPRSSLAMIDGSWRIDVGSGLIRALSFSASDHKREARCARGRSRRRSPREGDDHPGSPGAPPAAPTPGTREDEPA